MKTTIKTALYLALIISMSSFLSACGSGKKESHTHADGTVHEGKEHAADSHEGHNHEGEEHDHHGSNENYSTDFKTTPATPQAGQSVTLSLTPKLKKDPTAEVPLETNHGKKMHLIVVDEALNSFQHLHPDYQTSGNYDVKTTFKSGGNYVLFADYKTTEGGEVVTKHTLNVGGNASTIPTATTERLTWTNNGINLTLKGKFETGKTLHINGLLTQNGSPVNVETLENYLEAKAHIVFIEVADKDYIHVHPEIAKGNFHLHAEFEHSGMYRAWVQFMLNGKLQIADFVVNVAKGEGKSEAAHDHKH